MFYLWNPRFNTSCNMRPGICSTLPSMLQSVFGSASWLDSTDVQDTIVSCWLELARCWATFCKLYWVCLAGHDMTCTVSKRICISRRNFHAVTQQRVSGAWHKLRELSFRRLFDSFCTLVLMLLDSWRSNKSNCTTNFFKGSTANQVILSRDLHM